MRAFIHLFLVFGIPALWTSYVQDFPFFWDTVQLASKHAHHFYENSLRWTVLPAQIDSGHPPVFGYYLALVWTVFGKSLPASHWAVFPFLCGMVWLLSRIGRRVAGGHWGYWLLPLVILDPVFAGQSALVSPDIALLFFFLLALDGIFSSGMLQPPQRHGSTQTPKHPNTFSAHHVQTALGILGLCAISMRGMMTAAALFAWTVSINVWQRRYLWVNHSLFLIFLPGFLFAAWFLLWHYRTTGWIGYHAGSPWSEAFQPGNLRNILVVGWRWLDLGRVFEWLALFYIGVTMIRNRPTPPFPGDALRQAVLVLLLLLVLFLTPSAILYQNLSAHRYFLPAFVGLHIVFLQLLTSVRFSPIARKILLLTVISGLFTGNCWIYPRGVSMDWDSTLAHLPYHQLRSEALQFLDEQGIDFGSVGTAFPNINTGENLLLDGDQRTFSEKDFAQNDYILASNIFNDFSEQEYRNLEKDWMIIWQKQQQGVWITLYAKKNKQERI